jgi:crossover junction endodeoxyribonuclease RuvC
MKILGLDPGKSGGLAVVGDGSADASKFGATERDIWDAIRMAAGACDFAYIERVGAFPGQGVSSTFKFGQSYGFLRACLVAAGIPFEAVTPAKWQRSLACLSKGDKNVTKAKAQELFPALTITHAIADALLIAEYGRRSRPNNQVEKVATTLPGLS